MTLHIVKTCPACQSASVDPDGRCFSCGNDPRPPRALYTSDTHFGHRNILKYCSRPYATIEDMNEGLIRLWNEAVRPLDTVYHLGDFGFGKFQTLQQIVRRLNGRKIIIKGNHDRGLDRLREMGFDQAGHSLEHQDGGHRWLLVHNPADAVGTDHKNVLCGHVHQRWTRDTNLGDLGIDAINVGVDVRNFTPQTLQQLLAAEI